MKQQRLLFLLCRFLDGGIDTIAVEYLNRLALVPNVKLTLCVAVGMGELEVFRSRLAENITVEYCVPDGWLSHAAKLRAYKRLPFLPKLADEVVLNPLRNILISRKINSLAAQNDVVVDFDFHASRYLHHCKAKKIAFYHFSLREKIGHKPSKIKRFERKLSSFDRVILLCNAMKDEAVQMFPTFAERFSVIYNACNQEVIEDKAQLMPDNQLINTRYILAVERLDENQKDISTLLRAYALFRQQAAEKLPLYIIGKGHSEQQLRSLAAELGVAESVVFLGFIANPYPWIAHAHVFAHSAKYEGFGMVLAEALLLGRVVVSTDCPVGPAEVLLGGKAGLLVEVGNAGQMAASLSEAAFNQSLRISLLARAKEHICSFSFDRTIPQFLHIIE